MKALRYISASVVMLLLLSCEQLLDGLVITYHNVAIEEIVDVPIDDVTLPQFKALSLISANDTTTFKDSLILNISKAEESDSLEQQLAESLNEISSIDIDTLSIEILKSYDDITLPEDFKIVTLHVAFSNSDSLIHSETHHDVLPGEVIISPITPADLEGISITLQNNRDLKVVASGTVIGDNGIEYFALKARVVADIETNMYDQLVLP